MTDVLLPLERTVLDFALAGDHPTLDILRRQAQAVTVVARDLTGHGFFTQLAVDATRAAIGGGPRLVISDLDGQTDALAHGVGFNVFVEDGYLAVIEGFSFDEPWPMGLSEVTLSYSTSIAPGGPPFPRPMT